MLNQADLPATGLIQPASRVSYRLAVASPANDDAVVQPLHRLGRSRAEGAGTCAACASNRWHRAGPRCSRRSTGPRNSSTWSRLLAALLAAVAVAIASRDFASRHLDDCAMLRVLGQSQRQHRAAVPDRVRRWSASVASALGVALGFAVHHVFVWLLAGLVESALPAATLWPALFGIGVGLTLLLGFGLPPVLQLARVPPLRVIRRDVGAIKPASLAVLGAGAARLRRAADGGVVGPQARPDRGRRFCRGGRLLRAAELGCRQRCCASRCPSRGRRAGWCWRRGRSPRGRPSRCCRYRRSASACWRWCCWCCCAPT